MSHSVRFSGGEVNYEQEEKIVATHGRRQVFSYNERIRERKILESEDELDELIRQYDAGRNVYVRIRNRLYTPRAFKDEYFLASNSEWDETPLWLIR